MKNIAPVLILFSLFIFISCSTDLPLQIINLDTAKNEVRRYYESGEFDRECSKIIDDAINKIDRIKLTDNSAVVFDIDETALSNYDMTKKIGFGFIPKLWDEWIQKGEAPAIKETKRFYDYLISKNIHVIFLTGRTRDVRDATRRNLIEQGFMKFDTLIVRTANVDKISAAEFKSVKREELVKNGYNIIASIGDQWSDLAGGNTGYKIKLPNYIYLLD